MPFTAPLRPATLYAFRGAPASGKSTQAQAMVAAADPGSMVRINKDALRSMMHAVWAGAVTEKQVLATRDDLVVARLAEGVDVVVDDTNSEARHIDTLAALAWECGATFEIIDLSDVDVKECIRRDALRGEASVGATVVRQHHQRLSTTKAWTFASIPDPIIAAEYDPDLPTIVLCDIDGTLAFMVDRSPYEWNKVGTDVPNPAVISNVRALRRHGIPVFVFSGRDGECRDITAEWLNEHVEPDLPLIMRAESDNRRDSFVKYELYNTHIRGRYNVEFVLDDRNQVVRMWRTLGLCCHQVAPGPF